jgi:SAM-dependent methyltransferase
MKNNKIMIEHDIIRADPLPSDIELTEFYEKYYVSPDGSTGYMVSYTKEEMEHKALEANIALKSIEDNTVGLKQNLKLLEFGCGEGFFLDQAQKEEYEISAIDFSGVGITKWNPHLLKYCQFGNIYDYLKEIVSVNKQYDIVVLRNVLEHVIEPAELLKNIKAMLRPNGIALITVPNDYSLIQKKALDFNHIEEEFWFAPPEHLYYFNSKNIKPYVEDFGFKVIDMYSSFPVDFFLFHAGSNYVKNKDNGKAAHTARVDLDLIMAQEGLDNILNLYRAMAKCGVGRNLTIVIKANAL